MTKLTAAEHKLLMSRCRCDIGTMPERYPEAHYPEAHYPCDVFRDHDRSGLCDRCYHDEECHGGPCPEAVRAVLATALLLLAIALPVRAEEAEGACDDWKEAMLTVVYSDDGIAVVVLGDPSNATTEPVVPTTNVAYAIPWPLHVRVCQESDLAPDGLVCWRLEAPPPSGLLLGHLDPRPGRAR